MDFAAGRSLMLGDIGEGSVHYVVEAGCNIHFGGVKVVVQVVGNSDVRNHTVVGNVLAQSVGIVEANGQEHIFEFLEVALVVLRIRSIVSGVIEHIHSIGFAVCGVTHVFYICQRLEAVQGHFAGRGTAAACDEIEFVEFGGIGGALYFLLFVLRLEFVVVSALYIYFAVCALGGQIADQLVTGAGVAAAVVAQIQNQGLDVVGLEVCHCLCDVVHHRFAVGVIVGLECQVVEIAYRLGKAGIVF